MASRATCLVALLIGAPRGAAAITVDVSINTQVAIAASSSMLVSHGWEAWQMLNELDTMRDPRAVAIASHLSPGIVRVGGITADWLRYVSDEEAAVQSPRESTLPPVLGGFWPSAPENITDAQLRNLTGLMRDAGLGLLFDLSELYGRNCNTTKPGCPTCGDWCGLPPAFPPWDTSNVRGLLQRLHDAGGAGGPGNALFGFELGNELAGHLDPAANTADIRALSSIIGEVWADTPTADRPLVAAPSTDDCWHNATRDIMVNVTGAVDIFTYHAYPAGDGSQLTEQLLNASWLRTGIMTGSDSAACLGYWNAGPRAAGMQLWVTEASSSWNWPGASSPPWPPGQPGQNSFLHGFFSLPQYGQYARTGVQVVARWAFCLNGGFATIDYDRFADRFDVAADFWLMVAHKRTMGSAVLSVAGDDAPGSPALVYAQCSLVPAATAPAAWRAGDASVSTVTSGVDLSRVTHPQAGCTPADSACLRRGANASAGIAGNGSVTLMAVNPSDAPVTLALAGSGGPLASTPRWEWVFSAPRGNLSALSSLLNDDGSGAGAPLRINADGSLPPLPGAYVGVGGPAGLTLPPRSQAFYVLLAAAAPACTS